MRELYTEDGDGEETYPLVDDEVDLEPLVRDAVLLELPLAPLCRPDCLGLCPSAAPTATRRPAGARRRPIPGGRARRPAGARGQGRERVVELAGSG